MVRWNIYKTFYETFLNSTHPDVREWPMMENESTNFAIIICYLVFVLYVGPAFMKNRPPFDLRRLMVPYNIALVIANFYIFWQYAKERWSGFSESGCVPLTLKHNPHAYRVAEITWWYYITKYIELTDTVFFVLRKKEEQLSKLHLVHHSTVPLAIWGMLRSEPGGYNSIFPLANSFVHCVMYTYYAISALGDEMELHLWFKKYVTMTQMIQFIFVLSYFISRPFAGCKVSTLSWSMNVFVAGFFFVLFSNFYWHAYIRNTQMSKLKKRKAYVKNGIVKTQ